MYYWHIIWSRHVLPAWSCLMNLRWRRWSRHWWISISPVQSFRHHRYHSIWRIEFILSPRSAVGSRRPNMRLTLTRLLVDVKRFDLC